MEENISRFVTAIIAIFILFVFPVYISYEKKDDISYALAVRYTQDFVDNVRKKGYITQELYEDYFSSLLATGNRYEIELEHEYVRYDGDFVDKNAASATRNIEVFTTDHILNVLNNGQVYTMNMNDNFNVKIKNTNVTLATVIYNIVTVNTSTNNVRIHVDYGGKILAEKWYEQGLKYSEYGGIVKEEPYSIFVSIDLDNTVNVGTDVSENTNPANFLSNNARIGDYVEYSPNGSTAYTIYLPSGTPIFLRRNDNIYWRIIDIDYENDQVTLVSANKNSSSQNLPSTVFSLKPKQDKSITSNYIAGINEACREMYSNDDFGVARSLTKNEFSNISLNDLKYVGYNNAFPSVKNYDSNNVIVEFNGIINNNSDTANISSTTSLYLRPVVELNEKVIIDYTSGGCSDTSRTCGTVDNPWKLLITKPLTIGDVAEISDYVKYVPDTVTTSVKIPANVSGHTSVQSFSQRNVYWQVLKKSGGKVLLVSGDITNYEYNPERNGLTLDYPEAFNNGVDILNNICKSLYSRAGVATARSLTFEDIKDLFNYDIVYTKHTLTNKATYPARLGLSSFVGNSPTKVESWLRTPIGYYITSGHQITLKAGDSKEIMAIDYTSVSSNNYASDKHRSLLAFNNEVDYSDYWLAQIGINYKNGNLDYKVFYMWDSTSITLYLGYSYKRGGIRAVVELDEDMLIDITNTGDGSSKSSPWHLVY